MKKGKEFINMFWRYIILILVGFFGIFIFYSVFGPLTIYPVYWILSIFQEIVLEGSTIIFNSGIESIEIIGACIAGSAYYLLSILNLATPNIKTKKRINMLLLAFVSFLIINILRILILSFMHINGSVFFDLTHKIFWYVISVLFVVGIWFLEVKLFKIKEIPFYSDLKFLYKKSSLKK